MDDGSGPALIINPPWIIAPDIGAFAVDVTHGAPSAGISAATPMFCLGGHPSQECLLDVRGSGPNHDVVVSPAPGWSSPFGLRSPSSEVVM